MLTFTEQVGRFDQAVQRALATLDGEQHKLLLDIVDKRGQAAGLAPLVCLGQQRARAALVGVSPQRYCDVLAGRKGDAGTALEWYGTWRQTTGIELDLLWILGERDGAQAPGEEPAP